ncbi:hypothetical protein [uncultured Tolumonas sp.]|uniref:hypothetical protein n=1 Tax=uncultured Tolumonas sp. TaxID=263765 RepID=UPI002A0A4164|nr:hypothetical protein [uncultured Tolumonas sp.]
MSYVLIECDMDETLLNDRHKICQKNDATQDIKAVCDYTTKADNNEGVIAELIEKFIFNQ